MRSSTVERARWMGLSMVVMAMSLAAFAADGSTSPPADAARPTVPMAGPSMVRVAVDGAGSAARPLILTPIPASASTGGPAARMGSTGNRSLRMEPVKSVIEWGVENSAEALIACQRGPYNGATVSAYSAWTSRSNAQPDHCYRF